ncbi:MAG: polysaccharide deacetylase family protein [Acidobacteriota bacterium]
MKPIASLSLDLDNQWSYMKTHGDAGWEEFPSYLDTVVPRALDFFHDRDLNLTFFVVGQDAALERNHDSIASIAAAGHEIGNHSFKHEPWLHLYSKGELIDEFQKTEDAIEHVTGRRTVGFRGPGFSLSPTVLEVLAERRYVYDCSTLPTYVAPLARAYYFFNSPVMSDEEREKRKKLFGKFSDGFQTLSPYIRDVSGRELVEIPVTTLPIIKTPIHASYVLYLATFSPLMAKVYWRTAMAMCSVAGLGPSLLIHPLDLLCEVDAPVLRFFPGMGLPIECKLEFLSWILDEFAARFNVVNMIDHANSVRNRLSASDHISEAVV